MVVITKKEEWQRNHFREDCSIRILLLCLFLLLCWASVLHYAICTFHSDMRSVWCWLNAPHNFIFYLLPSRPSSRIQFVSFPPILCYIRLSHVPFDDYLMVCDDADVFFIKRFMWYKLSNDYCVWWLWHENRRYKRHRVSSNPIMPEAQKCRGSIKNLYIISYGLFSVTTSGSAGGVEKDCNPSGQGSLERNQTLEARIKKETSIWYTYIRIQYSESSEKNERRIILFRFSHWYPI